MNLSYCVLNNWSPRLHFISWLQLPATLLLRLPDFLPWLRTPPNCSSLLNCKHILRRWFIKLSKCRKVTGQRTAALWCIVKSFGPAYSFIFNWGISANIQALEGQFMRLKSSSSCQNFLCTNLSLYSSSVSHRIHLRPRMSILCLSLPFLQDNSPTLLLPVPQLTTQWWPLSLLLKTGQALTPDLQISQQWCYNRGKIVIDFYIEWLISCFPDVQFHRSSRKRLFSSP